MGILGDAIGRGARSGGTTSPPVSAPPSSVPGPPADLPDGISDLRRRRNGLAEQVTELHWDLGGLAYEMAIRDHINHEVLTRKAAEMQRVDAELSQLEGVLDAGGSGSGRCPACDALYAPGSVFCSQCGNSLAAPAPDTGR